MGKEGVILKMRWRRKVMKELSKGNKSILVMIGRSKEFSRIEIVGS
jgi:hypothetical protein